MKRIIVGFVSVMVICCLQSNILAFENQARANYETLNKTTYERFHKNTSDVDNYYGYIRFYSTVNVNINTGLCNLAGKSATTFPSNSSRLYAYYKDSGYLENSSKFIVRWDYSAYKSDSTKLRSGIHKQSY